MRVKSGHILFLTTVLGIFFVFATIFAPDPNQRVFGVFFHPSLSRAEVLDTLKATSLSYVGFNDRENIIILEGDQKELNTEQISNKVWFIFNPNGFKACG
ncbi:hypothetical protein [Kordiimonas sp. SCSIO 12610]|uniref:hypothetical protein n=1 Tax=Kordiimonas sp. SCSIO 12610 TaxID=2829597 RepID=UPI00210D0F73|nr:hypothetical protein [Kordiimonas sp. SCSIO 12610]UTW56738.1 hypothetical protein KFF44_07575 [Kordiimonas sp. SCSIO 12610]